MKKSKQPVLFGILLCVLLLAAAAILYLIFGQKGKPEAPQIGLCFRSCAENPAYCDTLQQTLTGAGYDVHVADGANDQSLQTAQIGEMVEKGCALLVIEPVMVSTSDRLVEQVMEAQIPTVFINYELEGDGMDRWDKLTYVGCEKDSHGIMQGNMILREANQGDMNGDGTVSCLILSGPEDDRDAQLQAAGCVQALEKAGLSVSLLETRWGQWTAESGRKSCADALAQYGKDIEVIFCGDDRIALGAAEAIRSGGWTVGKDYLLIGLGGIEQAIEAVNMGNMTGTVAEDLTGQAKQVLAVARAILAGETLEKKYYVSCMKVTAENAQAYLPE